MAIGNLFSACTYLKPCPFCVLGMCEAIATPMGHLTRFNKIAIPNNKFQMASGQGSHWLIENPTIFSSMCSSPLSDICQFYFLNIFTLLALTQSFGSLFHSFITLCEKEYFLVSNLHCSLTNAALFPLVLLPSLSLKNTFLSTSS